MSAIKNIAKGPLKNKLIELIRLRGSMTVADYMKIVLTNPESGFYMNNDVFGVKGHFTTNPEISQIFGEVLGAWIIQEWRRFNCPKPLRLVEFGPGRGTLMADITRTLMHFKEVQKNTLSDLALSTLENTKWYPQIESLERENDGFTAYIAHEYLDALPIHKFVRDPNTKSWRELLIDYDSKSELRFCISKKPSLAARLLIDQNFEGDHIEVCPQAALCLEQVASRLNSGSPGCMLACDYGFEDEPEMVADDNATRVTHLKPIKSNRDTFRAFRNHELWPPLREPGEADLTADVDFGYLKKNLKDKATMFGSVDQRNFLVKCGIQERLNVLLGNASEAQRKELESGVKMMIDDMGRRYRLLAMFPKGTEHLFEGDPPAGFDTSLLP